ncbi:MAG: hypothetical protein C3F11_20775, partial [Methylocystaceae bacterium]
WFRDLLVREQARLIARRHLVAARVTEKLLSDVRHIVVQKLDGRLRLTLPRSITSALNSVNQLRALEDHVQTLVEPVGVPIDVVSSDDIVKYDKLDQPSAPSEEVAEKSFHTARDILIIVSGARARAIARHLTAPDWVPVLDGPPSGFPRYLLRRDADAGRDRGGAAVGRAVIDVVDESGLPPLLDVYGVVVWLVDDKALLHDHHGLLRYELGDRAGALSNTLVLVAPALPTLEPSRILSDSKRKPPLDLPFGCIIDTSLARSPFWTGNPRRAIDRRIGDIIIGSAMICAMAERVREDLVHAGPRYDPQILSFALEPNGPGDSNSELGLLSESSLTGLKHPRKTDVRESFSHFEVRPFAKSTDRIRSGYYFIRRHDPDFKSFVRAVISSLRDPKFIDLARGGASVRRSELLETGFDARYARELPLKVEQELAHPQLAVAFRSRSSESSEGIIITAETPSVAAVQAAFHAGWAIARYTDRETIWEALEIRSSSPRSQLPREVRLPQLQRLTRNRGLAVRGVDPRDIVRIALDTFESWRLNAPRSSLLADARGYRASIDDEEVAEIAIPRDAVDQALSAGDPAARELGRILGNNFFALRSRSRKRPGDLRAAWSVPSDGARRFVLEDGRLPISLMELPPNVVPAQRLFIIDGDGSVPALFTSRLFDVWARATLSRSMSWASRFSVSNTFETLPIPSGLVVLHEDAEIAQLRLARHAKRLGSLTRALDEDPRILGRRLRSEHAEDGVWGKHPLLEEIDEELLSMIDLPPKATNLDILDRLLKMNRE